jgi:uncharacterized protein YggT (Ycf19 family)
MAFGRRTKEVEEESGGHATAVQEREYVEEPSHRDRSELDAEEEVRTAAPSGWSVARAWMSFLAAFIGIALAVVEVILGFRLGFLLANANASNGFVDFIYDISDPLTDPFQGIISNRSVDGGVFEPASVIAMLVYLVAGALLIALVLAVANALAPHGDRVISSRTRHHEGVAREH